MNNPQSLKIAPVYFLDGYRTAEKTMTQQSKPKKWIGNPFRKENPAYCSWDVCKSISDTSDDNILEEGRLLNERRSAFILKHVSLIDQLVWQLQN